MGNGLREDLNMPDQAPRLFVEETERATVVAFSDTEILDSLVVREIQDELLKAYLAFMVKS